ncbi:MAG: efflux RND transporter periplasmic adaptor subunit [Betaproteobacteria bacterium]|nr:efflux RND transporter periplasmic adaptor subunit [Betaproteobacteria bacterium]MCL2886436.1 efflux RND transporter periplasmic adaptor subunit [Betaproteobacteria bacterium]
MNQLLRRLGPPIFAACLIAACSKSPPPPPVTDKAEGVTLSEASRQYLEIEPAGAAHGALGGVLPGRVAFQTQSMAAIGTPLDARVVSIAVRPGETVAAGAPLLTLQSADAAAVRADLVQAQAKAAAAEDMLQRQEEMLRKGVGLEVERFEAETAARDARANLERAHSTAALIGGGKGDRFVLRAPVAGVVLSVHATVGAVVSHGGDALVEVGDPKQLWVVAFVPESALADLAGKLSIGRAAEVRIPGADARFEAVLAGVGQALDGEQRHLPIYLALKGATARLTAGMLAEARLLGAGDGPLSVPTAAVLIKDGSRRIVYVQGTDGNFEPRTVRTGGSRDGRVTILEGLQPGERIVVRGALLLDSEAEQQL